MGESSPQSIHSTVHVRPANFTRPSTSLVIYFHLESYLLSQLIWCNIFRSILLLLPYLERLRLLNPTMATLPAQGYANRLLFQIPDYSLKIPLTN